MRCHLSNSVKCKSVACRQNAVCIKWLVQYPVKLSLQFCHSWWSYIKHLVTKLGSLQWNISKIKLILLAEIGYNCLHNFSPYLSGFLSQLMLHGQLWFGMKMQWDLDSGFPQTSLEKFQWFFNDISRQKSQISIIILNVTKLKNTGPRVTHGLRTHLMTTVPGVFKKIC